MSTITLESKASMRLTWLVQTLLNVTKANVCANMVLAMSFFASNNGIATRESRICGTNARDSIRMPVWEGC
jgi:hypothetical protein